MSNNGRSKKRRVFLVDDHPIIRRGVAQLIDEQSDLIASGEGGKAQEALQAIGKQMPDVVVVDLSLKGTCGLSLIKDLKRRYPDLPTLVLSDRLNRPHGWLTDSRMRSNHRRC